MTSYFADDSDTVCWQWADGYFMYSNATFHNNKTLISCVPDWTLANPSYVNNLLTRQCEYCGDSCLSCSSKYGWETWDGLEQNRSVISTIFNKTGYGTDFAVCNRCYSNNPYWETWENSNTDGEITWLGWGYGISNDTCSSWKSTSEWAASCSDGWELCEQGYYLFNSGLAGTSWASCTQSNCGIWHENNWSRCIDGYAFDYQGLWEIQCTVEPYYLGDWVTWNENRSDFGFREWNRWHMSLVMTPRYDSTSDNPITYGWATSCGIGQYVEYIYFSSTTAIQDYRNWEYCQVKGWYEWVGSNTNQCTSCQGSYYLLLDNIDSQ